MTIPDFKIKQYLLFFLMLGILAVCSVEAKASIVDLDAIQPLKALEFIPEQDFMAQTDIVSAMPYDDQFLSFSIRLPKQWVEVNENLSIEAGLKQSGVAENIFGVVAGYASPPKNYLRSRFFVEALQIPHEINTRNWFIHYLFKNGLTIEQVGLEKDNQIEALYVEVQGDTSYVVRAKVIKNGSRMILAKYYLPVEHYDAERIMQAQVIDSFSLKNMSDEKIEESNIQGFLDQSYFNFPKSWVLSAPRVRSINRMNAMILSYSEAKDLVGQINIYLTNKSLGTSRAEEMKFYREKFDIPNYKITELIATPKLDFNGDMTFGVTQVYKMESQSTTLADYELWVSIIENKGYYYFVSLLTPASAEDFYNWARNEATYRSVIESLRRYDSDVDQYQFLR